MRTTRVLLAGVSMRAAVQSATRAGFHVTMLDAFGDTDVPASVRRIRPGAGPGAPFSARAAARAVRAEPCDAVVYGSGFEHDPRAVAMLAVGRQLWGNAPGPLRRVRDPRALSDVLRGLGLAAPRVLAPDGADVPDPSAAWVQKPLRSGGGHHVRRWRSGEPVTSRVYLQEFIDGAPGSAVFVAAGGRARVLGVSRQLTGEAAFGASGFRYCGSILSTAGDMFGADDRIAASAGNLVQAVAGAFGLVGVNGIDFIARGGVPWPIEVNPRWSASMELVERAFGVSVFGAHAAACVDGRLPDVALTGGHPAAAAAGKAVVFARHPVVIGDTTPWLARDDVGDVPAPGERIAAGAPVCTVFATARGAADCHAALVTKAQTLYDRLAAWHVPARRASSPVPTP